MKNLFLTAVIWIAVCVGLSGLAYLLRCIAGTPSPNEARRIKQAGFICLLMLVSAVIVTAYQILLGPMAAISVVLGALTVYIGLFGPINIKKYKGSI